MFPLIGDIAFTGWPDGGPQYRVDLVNDTTDPLDFTLCLDDCESTGKTESVDPGESYRTLGDSDPNWWLVTDEQGRIRGCFKIDFDPSDDGKDLLASQLVPCPKG
jgi:hypothetical protein